MSLGHFDNAKTIRFATLHGCKKNGHSISLRLEKRKGRKDAPVSLLAVPYSICSHKILLPPTPPLASLDRGVDRTYDRFLTQKKTSKRARPQTGCLFGTRLGPRRISLLQFSPNCGLGILPGRRGKVRRGKLNLLSLTVNFETMANFSTYYIYHLSMFH